MMGDMYGTRVYQSKIRHRTQYLIRKTLRAMESRYEQRDRKDGAGYYDKNFARENHHYMKVRHYENGLYV